MEFEELKVIVSQVMKVDPDELKPDTTFIDDLGADSLDVMRIVMSIEELFAIKLPDDSIYSISTIEDAANLIKKVKKA